MRDTISTLPTDAGFHVETAAASWKALALTAGRPFGMVVADIGLPGGPSGLQVAQHARRRHPSLEMTVHLGTRRTGGV